MTAVTSTGNANLKASKAKRGFTLTEIAIVLGIIGLILGAIWAAASSVYSNQKSNNAQRGILATAQAVRSLYGTSATTNQPADTVLALPGVFPTDWQAMAAGVAIPGVFGNPWHLNPTAAPSFANIIANEQQFAVELDGLPDAGCASVIGFYGQSAAGALGGSVPGLVSTAVGAAGAPPAIAWPDPSVAITTGTAVFATPADCKNTDNAIAVVFNMSQM